MNLADSVNAQMRYMRHRSPRYIYNRTKLIMSERAHPADPWLTPGAVRMLTSLLLPSDRGVEFGSGRSTIWFGERVSHLTSVEHDEKWYSAISNKLKERELGNVDYALVPRDKPDELGNVSKYALTALRFDDCSIDFALIDGLYRDYVTQFMMPKIKPGGFLVIDNANWFLPTQTYAPASRTTALGPCGPVWNEVAEGLARWRSIWTSSGVTDTAIFFRT